MPKDETKETEIELAKKLIQSLDDAIQKGPWEKGLLFQTIRKKLMSFKEELLQELQLELPEHYLKETRSVASDFENLPDYLTVYISLYMSDGMNISKWEKFLLTLSSNFASRPIYKVEEDIRSILRAKENKSNDAYIVAHVKTQDIIPSNATSPPTDKFGHELIVLRQGSVQPRNISQFIHPTGRYLFKDGRLIKQGDQEY